MTNVGPQTLSWSRSQVAACYLPPSRRVPTLIFAAPGLFFGLFAFCAYFLIIPRMSGNDRLSSALSSLKASRSSWAHSSATLILNSLFFRRICRNASWAILRRCLRRKRPFVVSLRPRTIRYNPSAPALQVPLTKRTLLCSGRPTSHGPLIPYPKAATGACRRDRVLC